MKIVRNKYQPEALRQYIEKGLYNPNSEANTIRDLARPENEISGNKKEKEEWEKLRDSLRNPLVFGECDALFYGGILAAKRKISYFKAIEIASKRIEKLGEVISRKFPSLDNQSIEARQKEYFTALFRLTKY